MYVELRQISNVSDKVTEVGERLIEFRIMKADEPDIVAKYNHFQEEIISIGSIDFESDVSSEFGKVSHSFLLQMRRFAKLRNNN